MQFQRAAQGEPAEIEPTAHAGTAQPDSQRRSEGLIQAPLSGQQLAQHLGPDLPVLAPRPPSGGIILTERQRLSSSRPVAAAEHSARSRGVRSLS